MQNELQKAIYDKLKASAALTAIVGQRVYDDVPQGSQFPYVVLGDDITSAWDTDCKAGFSALITVHGFSRYQGRKEAKAIGDAVYAALHNAGFLTANFYAAACAFDTQSVIIESDGVTRHTVTRFRAEFLKRS